MDPKSLSHNDDTVLQQLFDPESAPTPSLLIDASQPEDPHYSAATLAKIRDAERSVIQRVEACMASSPNGTSGSKHAAEGEVQDTAAVLSSAAQQLEDLLKIFPESGALHNDLAQVLRLRHGSSQTARALIERDEQISSDARRALDALDRAIALLSPSSPLMPISPAQARTLAQAHMQRGALRHGALKFVPGAEDAQISTTAPAFAGWRRTDLEEAASRDFFMGGRYGNEIGRALAVHTNPTAKLCGQMVKDAMRREFAQAPATSVEASVQNGS